jgi:phospholipid-binding lipoprotein MlaA
MKGRICIWGSLCVLLISLLAGCATTGASDPRDPFEGFNRGVYSFNKGMDNILFDPLSKFYQAITPNFVDRGVTNFFSNLNDIAVTVNSLLQFKIDQALSDATRFIFNSTIGLFGFFDVSSAIDLPKHDEDFGQTLAVWGIGSGPFLMVPLFGPATIRDATGFVVDRGVLNPVFYMNDTAAQAGLLTLNYIDFKADLLSAKKLLGDAALDEYEFIKSAYFEKRTNQINDRVTAPDYSEE